jgi:hypothetical protein
VAYFEFGVGWRTDKSVNSNLQIPRVNSRWGAVSKPSISVIPPIRRQAADALRRARKLPIGHARNDLRQLAIGLLWLEKRGFVGIVEDRDTALKLVKEMRV